MKSQKHKDGKRRLQKKEAGEQDIAKQLVTYNKKTHMEGENLTESTQVFCVKVVSTFLHVGIPLNKLDVFRELLEENGYQLTDKRNMFDLILLSVISVNLILFLKKLRERISLLFLMAQPVWAKH